MFKLLPPLDVGDPKAFLAAAIATFAEYPPEVMDAAVPKIAKLTDRPTLKIIGSVCEEIYAPIERQIVRDRLAAERRLSLPPPRPETSQERRDAQVAELRQRFNLPPAGARPRKEPIRPGYAQRVAEDLARRRQSAGAVCGND